MKSAGAIEASGLTLRGAVEAGFAREVIGDAEVMFYGIKHDSRCVEHGDMFAAVPGLSSNGAQFLGDAVSRGAVAVLADRALPCSVPCLIADNVRVALPKIADAVYGYPLRSLRIVGVTGTNGKTTTTGLIEAMLDAHGFAVGVIGTLGVRGPGFDAAQGDSRAAIHTTPEGDDLSRMAQTMLRAKASHLVMEVSSHALALHRADAVTFDVAAFTNLTQDHLDFHGTMDAYKAAKSRLFFELGARQNVVCVDSEFGKQLASRLSSVIKVSAIPGEVADVSVDRFVDSADGIRATLSTSLGHLSVSTSLVGAFNLENIVVAVGCAMAAGVSLDCIEVALRTFEGVPGRLERIEVRSGVIAFVDYAHTPDAIVRALETLRSITKGRLICVFGAGGNRDAAKRPLMGAAAARGADIVIVTSDNPRKEVPAAIIADIEPGLMDAGAHKLQSEQLVSAAGGYTVVEDRHKAIALACNIAKYGDVVLIAGKGHETYQIMGDTQMHFDDREEVRRASRNGASA